MLGQIKRAARWIAQALMSVVHAPVLSQLRPAVRSRLDRRFRRPEKWDFREYAGDGFGWFQSRRTGEWRLSKIAVRNASSHVKKLYELE
jgi:hypothetical protein